MPTRCKARDRRDRECLTEAPPERRRRLAIAKLAMVQDSFEQRQSVSMVARKPNVNPNHPFHLVQARIAMVACRRTVPATRSCQLPD